MARGEGITVIVDVSSSVKAKAGIVKAVMRTQRIVHFEKKV